MGLRAGLITLGLVAALVAGNVPAAYASSNGAPALPVLTTLVAPVAGAVTVPPTAALRVPLDTTNSAWKTLREQFAHGRFGLRVRVASAPALWYVGPGVVLPPGEASGGASYDPATATVTASPSMPLRAPVTVTLAAKQSLQSLLAHDAATRPQPSAGLVVRTTATSFTWSFSTAASAVSSSTSSTASPGTPALATLTAGSASLTVTAAGTGTVTLATYLSAPAPASGLSPATSFFDVAVQPGGTFTALTIESCEPGAAARLSWYGASGWAQVSPQSGASAGCTSASLTAGSSPTIVELTGTAFASTPPPAVTGVSPASGPSSGGTPLTVSGSGFTGATAVAFGTTVGTGLTVSSDSSLTVTSPAGTGNVDVTVTAPGGTSATTSADRFAYIVSTLGPLHLNIGIPAYFMPGAGWSQLAASHPPVSVAVMNPASGPGTASDPSYVAQIAAARAAGVSVLGYVHTSYGTVPLSAVETEISEYLSWYHVNGVFVDEVSTDCSLANGAGTYYGDLSTWVRSQSGSPAITLNPGGQTNSCYLTVGDVIVNFAGDAATYVGGYHAPPWVTSQPSSRFWHIVYGVNTPAAAANVVALARSRNADTVYATDALSPAPYSRMPGANWWTSELAAAINVPSVSAVTPDTASFTGGDTVTVTGAGFSGATGVSVGGVAVSGFQVVSDSMIVFTSAGGPIQTVAVQVTGPGGTSLPVPADRISFYSGSPLAATPGGATSATGLTRYATSAGPREVTSGPDGNLWLTEGDNPNQIVRVSPSTGAREVFPLAVPDSGLSGITAGPDNNLWFTERWTAKIGRITPGGVITEFAVPDQPNPNYTGSTAAPPTGSVLGGGTQPPPPPVSTTVHAVPQEIVSGPGGALWFTDSASNRVGVASINGTVSEPYLAPTLPSGSGPWGLTVGGDGNVWFTEASASRIGMVNATTNTVTDYPTPEAAALPVGISTAPDGTLWIAESNAHRLVHVATNAPTVALADLATTGAPNEVVVGPDANLWYCDYAGMHRMTPGGARLDFGSPATEPVGLGITIGPDHRVWMVEYDGNSLDVKSPAVVDVMGAGASGTGTVDDGPVFKTALSQLAAAGGGTLLVPPGTYAIAPSDFVSVPSNVTMMGTGPGATITAFGWGYALLGASGSHLAISNMTVDGRNMVVRGIEVDAGSTDVYLGHLDVGHVSQPSLSNNADAANAYQVPAAIRIAGGGDHVVVDASTIHDVAAMNYDSSWPSPTARGVWVTQGSSGGPVTHHVTVQGSSISNVSPKDDGDCLVIQGTPGDMSSDASFVVRNDTFTACDKRAVKVQVPGAAVYADTITNAFLNNNVALVPTPNDWDMFSAVSVLADDVVVAGVSASGTGSFYKGIDLDAASGVALANVTVENDTITMGPSSSITYSSSISETAPVSGLLIASAHLDRATNGIRVDDIAVPLTLACGTNTFINIAHDYSFGSPYGTPWPC
ncbi:MAG: hypothetical protein NVS3B12_28940 [Acidimicrobiales bacterium]